MLQCRCDGNLDQSARTPTMRNLLAEQFQATNLKCLKHDQANDCHNAIEVRLECSSCNNSPGSKLSGAGTLGCKCKASLSLSVSASAAAAAEAGSSGPWGTSAASPSSTSIPSWRCPGSGSSSAAAASAASGFFRIPVIVVDVAWLLALPASPFRLQKVKCNSGVFCSRTCREQHGTHLRGRPQRSRQKLDINVIFCAPQSYSHHRARMT